MTMFFNRSKPHAKAAQTPRSARQKDRSEFTSSRSWLLGGLGAILRLVAIAVLPIVASPMAARAVGTSHWIQQSEADWKAGTFEGVVATNLGDLKLSRAVKTLLSQDSRISSVYCFAEGSDGTMYAGTGPQGVLLAIKGETVSTVAQLGDNVNIFSMLFDDQGRLLIGTGGDKGQILRLDHPDLEHADANAKPKEIFSADGVQYIWAIAKAADRTIYAATGPNGQLFQINPDGSSKVLFSCEENNLLTLIGDDKDTLYVGSDPSGLVYRINRKSGDAFILYDAQENEVKSLALDAQGNLYAATAESGEPSKMTASGSDNADRIGRPEKSASQTPLPSQPPASPKPPSLPLPGPGEPAPIPKGKKSAEKAVASHPLSLRIMDDPAPGDPAPAEPPADQAPADANAPANSGNQPQQAAPSDNPAKNSNGNAIYRITPDGFVTEVFREPVTVLSLIEHNGTLMAGTGNEGTIYQIEPAAEETIVAAKVDPKDVTCLYRANDGRIWMGLANSGQIATLGATFASTGTYTSAALDAKQVSRFGKINLRGSLPKGNTLTVATRSGNVDDPANKGWSKWSDELPATEFVSVTAPSARFLQYRLTFGSSDGKQTAIVDSVNTSYQMPNVAPAIHSVKVAPANANKPANGPADSDGSAIPPPSPVKTITWDASDPNDDVLQYTLYFRTGSAGEWILLKDKLTDATFDWNTRNVADGHYQVKIVASDAGANPIGQGKSASRVSEEVIVDNTPPVVGDLKVTAGHGEAKIEANVVDQTSTVAALAFSADSTDDWQAVLPVDTIADSPEEAYSFVVGGLSAGSHQVTLRATDSQGNQSFTTVTVTAEAAP